MEYVYKPTKQWVYESTEQVHSASFKFVFAQFRFYKTKFYKDKQTDNLNIAYIKLYNFRILP